MFVTMGKTEELFNKSTGDVCADKLKRLKKKETENFNVDNFIGDIGKKIQQNNGFNPFDRKNLEGIFGKNGVIEQLCSRLYTTTRKSNFVKIVKNTTNNENFIECLTLPILGKSDIQTLEDFKNKIKEYLTLEKRNKNKNIGEKLSSIRKSNRFKVIVTAYTIALIDTRINKEMEERKNRNKGREEKREKFGNIAENIGNRRRKQVVIEQAASISLELEKLRKKLKENQPKANSNTFYTWHNTKLGPTNGITAYNRWYGDKCNYGKDGVTLLFPSAYMYSRAARDYDSLMNIILDENNWKYFESSLNAQQGVHQDPKDKISSIYEYYTYLNSKGKIE